MAGERSPACDAVLLAAFPRSLHDELSSLLGRVRWSGQLHAAGDRVVVLGGEALRVPYRIYAGRESLDDGRLSARELLFLRCVFTRHHDGIVRERCLRNIIESTEPWVVPFVVQLVGEYVLEILEVIQANLGRLPSQNYVAFLRENPAFFARTRARVASYWDCYYRDRFRDPKRYPGFAVLEFFDALLE